MGTFRLEIVTGNKGLEYFIWDFFPRLVPTAQEESFCIYACSADEPLDEIRQQLLESWVEEEIIVAYKLSESDKPVLKSHLTPVEAEALSGYSEEYWRQQAWKGNIPGAIKSGKQWLLPRSVVEERKKGYHENIVGIPLINSATEKQSK
jgi:hypothetical protein